MRLAERLKREGITVSTDPEVVSRESQDLTAMSPYLSHLSKMRAEAVVYPKSEEEVVKVVELALEEHVPIVPRGSGRNNVGGVIPLRGGIVVNLTGMNKLRDEENKVVAQPGAKYYENGKLTFNARIYPSTFKDGVTVGGNFEGGCGGIGAFKYNRVWYQAEKVRVVNPRGKAVEITADDVKVVAHAEGTTGIITEITFLKKEWEDDETITLSFPSFREAVSFALKAYDDAYPIYHLTLRSPRASELLSEETGVPAKGWYAILAYPKGEGVEIPKGVEVVKDGGRLWERRDLFFGGIIWFHWRKFGRFFYMTRDLQVDYLEELLEKVTNKAVVQVEFLRGGIAHPFLITLSKEEFEEVKREARSYPGREFDLHDVTINGRLDRDHLQKIITYKKAFDKEDLFNPGKVKFSLGIRPEG